MLASSTLDLSRIGCSDLATLLGESEHAEPIDLYNRIVHGIAIPERPWLTEAGDLGKRYERATAEALLVHRMHLDPESVYLDHPPSRTPERRAWQRYSLDFTIGVAYRRDEDDIPFPVSTPTVGVIECKMRSSRSMAKQGFGADGSGDVPISILLQVVGQMEATRADRDWWRGTSIPECSVVDLAVVEDGQTLHHYRVAYDAELAGLVVETAEQFWRDHIEAERPPPYQWNEGTRRDLMRRFPSAGKTVREASEEEIAIAMRLLEIKQKHRKNSAEMEALEAQLCAAIGEDRGIECEAFRALWYDRCGYVATKALTEELAMRAGLDARALDVLREGFRGPSGREFRITQKKGHAP